MKKTIILSLLTSTSMCSATILDLTGFNNVVDSTLPSIFTAVDVGNGVTVDITLSGDIDNTIAQGLGNAGGGNNQLDNGEFIDFTFTNIQAGADNTAIINFLGLVSDATAGATAGFIFGTGNNDNLLVSTDTGQNTNILEANTSPLSDVTLTNTGVIPNVPAQVSTVNGPITLTEGDTLTITPGPGDQFRIQGLQLSATVTAVDPVDPPEDPVDPPEDPVDPPEDPVDPGPDPVVPEPTSIALLGIGGFACLLRRKR